MTRRASIRALLALLPLVLLPDCRRKERAAAGQPAVARTYEARGEVAAVPRGPTGEVFIRHEAIPDFVDASGRVVGMDSMVMSFRVEPPLSAEGLAPGDKVAFRFSVSWNPTSMKLDALQKLPPDTALQLGPGRPAPERAATGK